VLPSCQLHEALIPKAIGTGEGSHRFTFSLFRVSPYHWHAEGPGQRRRTLPSTKTWGLCPLDSCISASCHLSPWRTCSYTPFPAEATMSWCQPTLS